MKLCVIGGAGYIGSHVVLEAISKQHDVFVIDNLSTGKQAMVHPDARFYHADILDKETTQVILAKENMEKPVDVILHFAAKLIVFESVSQPLAYYHNNVVGLYSLLSMMKETKIQNLIFSSTAAVYGNSEKEQCEETDPTNPINPYGETKLASEKMIQWVSAAEGFNYGIFRYFNVAGAHESATIGLDKDTLTHIIPVTMQAALHIRDHVEIYGDDYPTFDGSCIRDYIHVSDLAEAHILGAQYLVDQKQSFLLNLGSNQGYSVKQVIAQAKQNADFKVIIGPKRAGDPAKLIASNKKAKQVLGWQPKRDLAQIVATDYAYRLKLLNKK